MRTSDTLSELAPALVKAAAELTNPARTADNPFFKSKYTPLNAMLDHLRPVLASHGLCAIQSAGDGITTMIVHESGEWIETDPLHITPVKNDPQGVGSATTYGRRYSLAAALGIEGESDDDGNHATGQGGAPSQQQRPPAQSGPPPQQQGGGSQGGGVEPKKHDGDGFEMHHYPAHKSGSHVFAKGPNAGRWNGKNWEELAKLHGANPADSPLVDMMNSEFMGGWNKEHAAYLAATIDANTQPAPPAEGDANLDIPF